MKRILPWVISVLLALICLNISPSSAAADNLVVNGSFEDPAVDYLGYPRLIPGWKLSDGSSLEIQHGIGGKPYDGEQLAELDGNNAVSEIYQDITTDPGKTYKLTFAFSPRRDVADNKLNVSWGDTQILKLDKSGKGLSDTDWEVYPYGVKATSSQTRLSFDNLNETVDGLGSYIDGVSLEPLVCKLGDEDCKIIITPDETFILPVTIPIPEDAGTLPLDLMLTQDLTSSFSDDMPVLKSLIPDLVKQVKAIQPNTKFGLASFTDKKAYGGGNPNYYVYKTELPLTSDSNVFEKKVAGLATLPGGSDFPESSLSALMQVALRANSELGFGDDTRRVAIISTDDAYKQAGNYRGIPNNGDTNLDENEDYPSVAQVKKAINEANMVPIFLVTSGFVGAYNNLVSQLGVGAVVGLAADSSNLIAALEKALEVINQQLTVVPVSDEYGYVESIDPDSFKNVPPGSEVTTNVTFKYSGRGTGDDVTIRALGIGDLVVDVKVVL